MKKGNAGIIGLVIIVILVAGAFFVFNSDDSSESKMEKDDSEHGDEMMMEEGEKEDVMMGEGGEVMEEKSSDGAMIKEEKPDLMMTEESGPDLMTMEDEEMEVSAFSGNVLAGTVTPLIDFNKADYDKALKEKKLIALYFYADWCPTCKKETAEALYPAFDDLNEGDVVGFRVNYNDKQTDSDEKGLAREFGVAYQHTKVFLKNGERILKSPESWSKERYLEEINKNI